MRVETHTLYPSLLDRARGEFLEMPGLALTVPQACRLWALDERTCLELLDALVQARFLRRGARGRYLRADLASAC